MPSESWESMRDRYNRSINYMRLSITDRCNLRCRYCMPEGLRDKLPMQALLSYEELLEIAAAAVRAGITRFKVTGGEPLVRRHAEAFIGRLKALPGVEQVTLTTNGLLLSEKLPALRAAGIDGVNISLDTLDAEKYREITGYAELARVLRGIEESVASGIPVKLNAVLQRGVNDGEWRALAELARTRPLDVRFIEMMPIGYGRKFPAVYNEELLQRFRESYSGLEWDERTHGNGPAVYIRIPGFQGAIGFISAMHGKFCGACNRIRLTSVGKLKPCLCYGESVDLMPILRDGGSGGDIERQRRLERAIREAVAGKPEAHHFEHISEITEEKEMVRIGG